MRNSNISREGRTQSPWLFKWFLGGYLALCLVNPANALGPNKTILQYLREEWSVEQGFPGGKVYAIDQTPNGYLRIGAEKGLVRFDGLRFQLFERSSSSGFPSGPIVGLVVDTQGTLWVRPLGLKLLRYREGEFRDILQNFQVPEGTLPQCAFRETAKFCFPGSEGARLGTTRAI